MTDPTDLDSGITVEFSAVDRESRLPATADEHLREQLPGLETEREITDWGRSRRVEGIVDRTLYGFLYHYWFRVEVDGADNVPDRGAALLLANHAGAIPADAGMIAKAVREQCQRELHIATDRSFTSLPGIGMLASKIGTVPAHPANLQRLLFDERELVLAFPEGGCGPRKPLKERYRLRGFGSEFIEAARRAAAPIVPVAVVGSEEAAPVLARVGLLRRLRLPLASTLPLPAKFQIRFLEPTDPAAPPTARELQGLIQENLLEMVAMRRSVWLG